MGSGLFLQAEEQPWIIWSWLFTHVQLFVDAIEQHLLLTVIAVGVGLAISLPLAVLAHRWRRLRNPVLTVFGIFYTIPSLALFSVLVPYTGLSVLTAEIGLVGYTVLILARNILVGLEAVPADVIDNRTHHHHRDHRPGRPGAAHLRRIDRRLSHAPADGHAALDPARAAGGPDPGRRAAAGRSLGEELKCRS